MLQLQLLVPKETVTIDWVWVNHMPEFWGQKYV